jgi:excisionase family DNA binding protein
MYLTQERYLTVDEVAAVLRLHPETVKTLLRNEQLPGRKVGRQWRVSQTALEEYMRGDIPSKKQTDK